MSHEKAECKPHRQDVEQEFPAGAETGSRRNLDTGCPWLVPNPKNKEYSLEDIEQLASMIQMTHNIEPATARKLEDGRFMLTSGHRRRLAQLYRFEQGWIDKPMMPVIHREIINDLI